jgi:hypothetical protein
MKCRLVAFVVATAAFIALITKVVRADDGTMPPEMRRIVDALHASISGARQ